MKTDFYGVLEDDVVRTLREYIRLNFDQLVLDISAESSVKASEVAHALDSFHCFILDGYPCPLGEWKKGGARHEKE